MSRTLYPIHTEPVSTQPETVTESRWHQPFSEPVRRKKGLAAALIVALAAPVFVATPEVVTLDKWLYQWTDPVRSKPGLDTHLQSTTVLPVAPITGSGDVTFSQIGTSVPYKTTILYQSIADPVRVAPEVVTLDKWLYQWVEPVRNKLGLAAHLQSTTVLPVAPVAAPEVVTLDKWLYQWTNPVRKKPGLAAQPTAEPVRVDAAPETITLDKWLYQWTNPVRSKPGLATWLQYTTTQPIAPVRDVSFSYTETTVPFKKTILYQVIADPVRVDVVEATPYGWFNPFSEPQYLKSYAALQQSIAFVKAEPFPETVNYAKFGYGLSEPVRLKKGLGVALQSTRTEPIAVGQEVVTLDKWFKGLDDPTRRKGIHASRQQVLSFAPLTAFGSADVSFAISSTVGTPYYSTLIYQSIADVISVPPESVTLDKWYAQLATPTRRKSGHASWQQYLSLGPHPVTASLNGWGQPLAEPVRLRRAVDVATPFVPTVTAAEIVTADKWFTPLSEPRRKKPSVVQQQDVAFVKAAPFSEIVTLDKWYRDLATPVKRWLRSHHAALADYSFRSAYLVPAPYVDPPMASWTYSWSMPVRVRTSVMTASQQASVIPEIPQPNPPPAPGVYTVSGLYVIDQFTDNTVVYNYGGGVSHRTN